MPEVYVHAVEGRTAEQKKALMLAITDAMVKHFNAAADSVTITIMEAPKAEKMKGESYSASGEDAARAQPARPTRADAPVQRQPLPQA